MKSLKLSLLMCFFISFSQCKETNDLGIRGIPPGTNYGGKLKSISYDNKEDVSLSKTENFIYDTFSGSLYAIVTLDVSGDTLSYYTFVSDEKKRLISDTTVLYKKEKTKKVRQYNFEGEILKSVTESNLENEESLDYELTYSPDGNLKKIQVFKEFGSTKVAIGSGEFQWSAGNLTQLKDNLNLGSLKEYLYQYTDHPNFLYTFFKEEAQLFDFDASYVSQNELRAYKSIYSNQTIKVDYEHNKNEKPILKTFSELKQGVWQVVEEISYSYWD